MKKINTQLLIKLIILVVVFFSSFFMRNVRVPFTKSGLFAIYYSDFFSILAWLGLLFYFIKEHKIANREFKKTFIVVVIFGFYCLFILGFRYATGSTEILNSLIVPRTIFMSIWIYLMFLMKKTNQDYVEKFIVFISLCLSVISLLLLLDDSRYSYVILQSNAIRIVLQIILYPLITYIVIKKNKMSFRIVFHTATISLLYSGFVSGSRLYALLIPVVIFISIYTLYLSKKNYVKETFIIITLVLTSIFGLSLKNDRVEFGLRRNPITTMIFKVDFVDQLYRANDKYPNNNSPIITPDIDQTDWLEDQANASALDSTAARIYVYDKYFKDIARSPVFGSGLKQYEYTYQHIESLSAINIYPHNFILEYTASFGILGLFQFIVFTWLLIFKIIINNQSILRSSHKSLFILSIFGVVYAILIGLVQPVFLNTIVMMYMYFSLGYFVTELSNQASNK